MAIEGRYKYMVYLDANDVELVKEFFSGFRNTGGLSGILNDYIGLVADEIRESVSDGTIDDLIMKYIE